MTEPNNPIVEFFPVVIPPGFTPMDPDKDGVDLNWRGRPCPGFNADDGFRPRWGGGFRAPRGEHHHAAIDIMAATGAEVRAIAAGKVLEQWEARRGSFRPGAGSHPKGGNYCVMEDEAGFRWYFAHMAGRPLVAPGDTVEAGQLLGRVGRTGNARRRTRDGGWYGCPHLHLSLTRPNWRVRPMDPSTGKPVDLLGLKVDPVPFLRPLYEAGMWKGPETATKPRGGRVRRSKPKTEPEGGSDA